MSTGEYLGVRLADLGFTGTEDFEIRATIPNIPGLKVVGQFGLYAGSRSDRNIRGGLISWPEPDTYRLFLVNNSDGDRLRHLRGRPDDHRRRPAAHLAPASAGAIRWSVDNLTRNSSSTLAIAHPGFLDGENDLYVGLFGANTQSDLAKTLTIREVSVTVWTTQPASPTMVASAARIPTASRLHRRDDRPGAGSPETGAGSILPRPSAPLRWPTAPSPRSTNHEPVRPLSRDTLSWPERSR